MRKDFKNYKLNISLSPKPTSCHACPFWYMPEPECQDTAYEHWDCYIRDVDSKFGVALERAKNCILDEEENNIFDMIDLLYANKHL